MVYMLAKVGARIGARRRRLKAISNHLRHFSSSLGKIRIYHSVHTSFSFSSTALLQVRMRETVLIMQGMIMI